MMSKLHRLVIVFIVLSCTTSVAQECSVVIDLEGLSQKKGRLIVAVFTTQEDFEKELPFYEKAFAKNITKSGKMSLEISLSAGTYGITILDDEDGDRKMKYRLGIPREGFGIVNLETSGFRKPQFSEFSFVLNQKNDRRKAKMRYIF